LSACALGAGAVVVNTCGLPLFAAGAAGAARADIAPTIIARASHVVARVPRCLIEICMIFSLGEIDSYWGQIGSFFDAILWCRFRADD
jgi:hypothetical protein